MLGQCGRGRLKEVWLEIFWLRMVLGGMLGIFGYMMVERGLVAWRYCARGVWLELFEDIAVEDC